MERDELFKKIEAGQMESVYLFSGPETYIRWQAEKNLTEKLMQPGTEMMNLNILIAPTVDQIMESADLFPFMSEYRLIIVRELGLLGKASDGSKGGKGTEDSEETTTSERKGKGIIVDDTDRLIEYLGRVPSTTCILFDGGDGIDKRKKLGKFLSGLPGCVRFEQLDGSELQKWIKNTVKKAGAEISSDAGERLVFLSGRDLTQLSAEIEKLAAYVGPGGIIREDAVDLLATRTSESRVFEMIDLLFDGKTEAAFSQMESLLNSGESRAGILALILRQFRQMMYAESMNREGRTAADITREVGVPSFVLRKVLARAGKMGIETLKGCFERCIQTEYDFKRGMVREEDGFDRLMMELADIAVKKNNHRQ